MMGTGGVGGADRISRLPDHLLHTILLRLPTISDAARTSTLSHRWRTVWNNLPDLSFRYKWVLDPWSDEAQNRVNAALNSYSAPTMRRLEIIMPSQSRTVTAKHVSSWLSFASERLAGELQLMVPYHIGDDEGEVLLPPCEKVVSIGMNLSGRTLRFLLSSAPAGAFEALGTLSIVGAQMDYRELGHMVSYHCPCLKKLILKWVTLKDGAPPILSIHSASLEQLEIIATPFDGRLEVAAPKLTGVRWVGMSNVYDYDPSRHHFSEAGSHLRHMEVKADSSGSALMKRFNNVDELKLNIHVEQDKQDYKIFLEDMNILAKCEVLVVSFLKMKHAFNSTMLHLLRKCSGIRKLVVEMDQLGSYTVLDDYPCKIWSGCPCAKLEGRKTNKVVFNLLEEIEVRKGKADHIVQLVRFLCRCSAMSEKRVIITILGGKESEYIDSKIRSIIMPPNNNVDIIVLSA